MEFFQVTQCWVVEPKTFFRFFQGFIPNNFHQVGGASKKPLTCSRFRFSKAILSKYDIFMFEIKSTTFWFVLKLIQELSTICVQLQYYYFPPNNVKVVPTYLFLENDVQNIIQYLGISSFLNKDFSVDNELFSHYLSFIDQA